MLARLQIEHDQILKTLDMLEMQFLDICRGGTPDYSLMRSVIEYIQDYPEQVHHPLEDQIFSILLERVDEVKLIKELITEHTELEMETRKLKNTLELLKSGAVSSEEIKNELSTFLIRQRHHIYIEEERVHPIIKSVLTEKDWEHVQSSVPLYR